MKRGDVVKLKGLVDNINGLRVVIVRRSRHTGGLTVRFLEGGGGGAYKIGDEINVNGWEVKSVMETRQ